MPKVSVIVPIYGVEKYIERCARSLFEQTLTDIEILFIDDCSPDKSIEVLQKVINEYQTRLVEDQKVVRIERMPVNSGLHAVRQYGIKFATGDYIAHCDSDDWVEFDMYERMYNEALLNDVDVVVCDYAVTDGLSEHNVISACHAKEPKQLIENCLLQIDSWSLWNKLFRREFYANIVFPKGDMGEDMVTTIQLLWKCNSLAYINKPFYQYFYNPSSITKTCTKDICIKKYEQLSSNAEIVLNMINSNHLNEISNGVLIVYKNFIRSVLYPIVYEKFYFHIWNNIFPGLNKQVLFSKHVSMLEKCRVFFTMIRLYPRRKNRAF